MSADPERDDSQRATTLSGLACTTPDEKHLRLWTVQWERGGRSGAWTFASRKAEPDIQSGRCRPDAVIIVPMVRTAEGTRLVVTREFRVPIGDYEYAFPAGIIDNDEDPTETAARELREETGLELTDVLLVSPPLYSSAGMTDESVVIVYCNAAGSLSVEHMEASEEIHTLLLTREGVADLVHCRGRFAGAKISAKAWPVLQAFLAQQALDRATREPPGHLPGDRSQPLP